MNVKDLLQRHPGRIPVKISRDDKCPDLPMIDKHKYLVPVDLTVGQFIYVIRKRLKISSDQALFLLCENSLPKVSECMSSLYSRHVRTEGDILEMTYTAESAFG